MRMGRASVTSRQRTTTISPRTPRRSGKASRLWRTLEAAHMLYMEEVSLTRARESVARAEAKFLALTGRGDLLGVTLPPVPGGKS